jgi:hypothetical protein
MDGENYLEIVLSKRELFQLGEKMLLSNLCEIEDQIFNVGLRLATKGEDDATSKRDK